MTPEEDPGIQKLRMTPQSGDLRGFEQVAATILSLSPAAEISRTRDAIQIDWGEYEDGVVILLTPDAIEFRLPSVDWVHPGIPERTSQLWKRAEIDELDDKDLVAWIMKARQARKRQFKKCQFCGEMVPPEHRFDGQTCHGCASDKYEVDY